MADRVQECFTASPLVEGVDGQDEELVLVVLLGVAQIDQFPQAVEDKEERLAEILALRGWPGGHIGAVLEDNLCLREIFGEALVSPHQYQRGVGDAFVGDGVAVHQQLPVRKRLNALQATALKPALEEIRYGVFVQIGQRRAWTDVGGEVVPSFLVDSPPNLVRHRHEAVADPPPGNSVFRVLHNLTDWSRRHDEHQHTMVCVIGQLREIDIDV